MNKQTSCKHSDVNEAAIFELFERLANLGQRIRKFNTVPNHTKVNLAGSQSHDYRQDQD